MARLRRSGLARIRAAAFAVSRQAGETILGAAPRSNAYQGLRKPARTGALRATPIREAQRPTEAMRRVDRDMIWTRSTVPIRVVRAPDLAADLGDLFRDIATALLDPYRPELHYMRGPGPKWRAKHAPVQARENRAMLPALIRLPGSVRRGSR
jgi:hypothetical protein